MHRGTVRPVTDSRLRSAGRAAVVGVVLALALAGCGSSSPVLLDKSDFEGVEEVVYDEGGAQGWTWCDDLSASNLLGYDGATTWLSFGAYNQAGATLVDGWAPGLSADFNLERIKYSAEQCADGDAPSLGYTIEELTDLDEDAVGWRTESSDGEWGEYVVIKLDDWRVLAVGFSTREPTAPVEIGELVRLAREGASQFEPDED